MKVAAQRTDEIGIADHLTHAPLTLVEHRGTNDDGPFDIIWKVELRWDGVDNGIDIRLGVLVRIKLQRSRVKRRLSCRAIAVDGVTDMVLRISVEALSTKH